MTLTSIISKYTKSTVEKVRGITFHQLICLCSLITLLLVIFPLFGRVLDRPVLSIVFIASIAVLTLGGVLLTRVLYRGNFKQAEVPALFVVWHLLLGWLYFTSALGLDFSVSFWGYTTRGDGLYTLTVLTLLAWIIWFCIRSITFRKHLVRVAVATGVITALSVYLSGLPFVSWGYLAAGFGLMANSSYTASFLVFPLGFAVYGFCTEKKFLPRALYTVSFIFIVINPLLVNWTTGVLGSPLSLLGDAKTGALSVLLGIGTGVLFIASFARQKWLRIASITVSALLCLGFVFANVQLFHQGSVEQRVFVEQATPTRLLYWSIAGKGFAQKPILGWGWNHYDRVNKMYFNPINLSPKYYTEPWVDKPHNAFVEFAVAGGAPAAILLFTLMVGTIGVCVWYVYKRKLDVASGAIFSGIYIALGLQIWFLFFVPITILWLLVTTLFVSSLASNHGKTQVVPMPISPLLRLCGILVLWAGIALVGIHCIYLPVTKFNLLNQEYNIKEVSDQTSTISRMFDLSPWGRGDGDAFWAMNMPDLDTTSVAHSHLTPAGTLILRNNQIAYLEVFEKLSKKTPYDYRTIMGTAWVANAIAQGSTNEADKQHYTMIGYNYALRAIALSPEDPLGFIQLSLANLSMGENQKALHFAQYALSLEPLYNYSQDYLQHVLELTGQSKNKVK